MAGTARTRWPWISTLVSLILTLSPLGRDVVESAFFAGEALRIPGEKLASVRPGVEVERVDALLWISVTDTGKFQRDSECRSTTVHQDEVVTVSKVLRELSLKLRDGLTLIEISGLENAVDMFHRRRYVDMHFEEWVFLCCHIRVSVNFFNAH